MIIVGMEPYQIILLIVVFLTFFYLAYLVYCLGQMREFRSRMKRRLRGLNLILFEWGTTIQTIYSMFEEAGITLSEEDEATFFAIEYLRFDKPIDEIVRSNSATIKKATSRLKYIASSNKSISESKAYLRYIDLLNDLERNYRMSIGSYNSDVIAYNYWIAVPMAGWCGFLFGHHKKGNLS